MPKFRAERVPEAQFGAQLFLCHAAKTSSFWQMPKLGYGVYQTPPQDTKRCVLDAIEALDSGESLFFSHYDPKTVEWFMSIV